MALLLRPAQRHVLRRAERVRAALPLDGRDEGTPPPCHYAGSLLSPRARCGSGAGHVAGRGAQGLGGGLQTPRAAPLAPRAAPQGALARSARGLVAGVDALDGERHSTCHALVEPSADALTPPSSHLLNVLRHTGYASQERRMTSRPPFSPFCCLSGLGPSPKRQKVLPYKPHVQALSPNQAI